MAQSLGMACLHCNSPILLLFHLRCRSHYSLPSSHRRFAKNFRLSGADPFVMTFYLFTRLTGHFAITFISGC